MATGPVVSVVKAERKSASSNDPGLDDVISSLSGFSHRWVEAAANATRRQFINMPFRRPCGHQSLTLRGLVKTNRKRTLIPGDLWQGTAASAGGMVIGALA